MAYGLIIEDDEAVRRVIIGYVKAARHTYTEATSLEEARQRIEQERFDFILLDLKIPFSLADAPLRDLGITCLKDIRGSMLNGNAAVIVVTSDNDHELAQDLRDEGADQYAWKPLETNKRPLADKIERALAMRSAPTPVRETVGKAEAPKLTLCIGPEQITINGSVLTRSLDFQQAKTFIALHKLFQAKQKAGNREGVRGAEVAIELGWVDSRKDTDETKVHREISRLRKKAVGLLADELPNFTGDMFIYNKGSGLGYCIPENVSVIEKP